MTAIDEKNILKILSDLIKIPSVNPHFENGSGEANMADYVERFLKGLGGKVIRKDVEPARPNVIGIFGEENHQTQPLLLEAHMDTVQTTHMSIDPFGAVYKDGKVFGRGACDTKASLAAMLAAVEWMVQNDIPFPVPVHLAAVVDEEYAFKGILDLLEANPHYGGAIVGEPTDMEIVVAHKGCVRFEIEVKGTACHSAMPNGGENAINKMAEVIQFINQDIVPELTEKFHPKVGAPTLVISQIIGGVAPNTVPENCRIIIDRRTIPGEDGEEVWHYVKHKIEKSFEVGTKPYVKVHPPFMMDYAIETAEDSTVAQNLRRAISTLSHDVKMVGVNYGTDASKIARKEIPAIVFGPGSIQQAHKKDEWVYLNEVVQSTEILIECIKNFQKPFNV